MPILFPGQSQVYVECTHINTNVNSFGGDSEFLATNVENVISLNETQRQVRNINQMHIENDTNEYIEETKITPENKDSIKSENDTNLDHISSELYEPEIKTDLTFDLKDQSEITAFLRKGNKIFKKILILFITLSRLTDLNAMKYL